MPMESMPTPAATSQPASRGAHAPAFSTAGPQGCIEIVEELARADASRGPIRSASLGGSGPWPPPGLVEAECCTTAGGRAGPDRKSTRTNVVEARRGWPRGFLRCHWANSRWIVGNQGFDTASRKAVVVDVLSVFPVSMAWLMRLLSVSRLGRWVEALHSSRKLSLLGAQKPVGFTSSGSSSPTCQVFGGRWRSSWRPSFTCGDGPNGSGKKQPLATMPVSGSAWPGTAVGMRCRRGCPDLINSRHGCGNGQGVRNAGHRALRTRRLASTATRPEEGLDVPKAEGPLDPGGPTPGMGGHQRGDLRPRPWWHLQQQLQSADGVVLATLQQVQGQAGARLRGDPRRAPTRGDARGM